MASATGGKVFPTATGGVVTPPPPLPGEPAGGQGLRVRLSRLSGQTPKGVLTQPIRFPAVVGDEWTFEEDSALSEYSTIRAGQFSQAPGGDRTARQLRTFDIDILSLDWDAPWLVYPDVDPQLLRSELYGILRSKRPVSVLAAVEHPSPPSELNMDATLRSVGRTLRHGEVDTRYYSLHFVEWRDPDVARRSNAQGSRGKYHLPTKHVLKSDTNLLGLSKRYYDSYEGWRAIQAANGLTHWGQKTPIVQSSKFKVGDSVKIPVWP